MTTIDFPQGVPIECLEWLVENFGFEGSPGVEESVWYYERRFVIDPIWADTTLGCNGQYMPSITIKDPKKAILFTLKWAGK